MTDRLRMLDGWRATSIVFVLAGHWFPIGPRAWGLNEAVAAAGMALFFTLSGFLITRLLLDDPRVPAFLIRRLFRIVPLAYLAMVILAVVDGATGAQWLANLLFFANLPPAHLLTGGQHLWSLCVEVQFYAGVALLVALAGRRGLYLLPLVAVAVTVVRAVAGETISIVTWHRVDEILAGATMALWYRNARWTGMAARLPAITPLLLLPMLVAAGHHATGAFEYLRPYIAAATVGLSLVTAPAFLNRLMMSKPMAYVAETSYAVYVFHGMLTATWLGEGSTIVKYAKRPLLIAATFALAHLSTRYYEARMIRIGKLLARRVNGQSPSPKDARTA